MESPSLLVLAFVEVTIIGVHQVIERRCLPFKYAVQLRPLANGLNIVYGIASLLGLLWWIDLSISDPAAIFLRLCEPIPNVSTVFSSVYFYSKLWEGVVDLTTVSLRGIPVALHFRVHHYTTPIFAWIGLHQRTPPGFLFAGLNLFMHALVYLWHGGVQVPFFKPLIRGWQHVQLLGGIVAYLLFYLISPCSTLEDIVPTLLFAVYYGLFQLELREEAAATLVSESKTKAI